MLELLKLLSRMFFVLVSKVIYVNNYLLMFLIAAKIRPIERCKARCRMQDAWHNARYMIQDAGFKMVLILFVYNLKLFMPAIQSQKFCIAYF